MKNNKQNNFLILEDSDDYEEVKANCEKLKGQTLLWILAWNSVSLDEPHLFNESYLAHVKKICSIAESFSINLLLTPDTSLFSLPSWITHELNRIETTNGALYIQCSYKSRNETTQNCLFTFFLGLFFAGNKLYPEIKQDGENIQYFLQNQCILAMKHSARRLKKSKNILGFYFSKILSADFIYSYIKELDSISFKNKNFEVKEQLNKQEIQIELDIFKKKFIEEIKKKHEHYIFVS